MKRTKHRVVTTTQKYAGEAKLNKYWIQWAERRLAEVRAREDKPRHYEAHEQYDQ